MLIPLCPAPVCPANLSKRYTSRYVTFHWCLPHQGLGCHTVLYLIYQSEFLFCAAVCPARLSLGKPRAHSVQSRQHVMSFDLGQPRSTSTSGTVTGVVEGVPHGPVEADIEGAVVMVVVIVMTTVLLVTLVIETRTGTATSTARLGEPRGPLPFLTTLRPMTPITLAAAPTNHAVEATTHQV